MSVRVSALVWEQSRHGGNALITLLKIADNCHDDGTGAYPSVAYLAKRGRMQERTVQYALAALRDSGELTITPNAGPHGTNLYQINLDVLARNAAIDATQPDGANFAPPQSATPANDDIDGAPTFTPPVHLHAPEPSFNRHKNQVSVNARAEPAEIEKPALPEPTPIRPPKPSDIWRAYCAGLDLTQQTPGYLQIEAKNRGAIAGLDWASTVLDLEQFTATARYLVERWQSGGVFALPSIDQVFQAMPEYERWQAAGRPSHSNRPRGINSRADKLPTDDYWRDMFEADYTEANQILEKATAERRRWREERDAQNAAQ